MKKQSQNDNVITIKIERQSEELNESQKNNITETALDNFNDYNYVIDNNGTLEELENKALDILKEVGVIHE